MKVNFIQIILCYLIIFQLWGCRQRNGETKKALNKPNIILILADDLGYGDLSNYGNIQYHTPNIDYLAHQGIKFKSFYSNAPICTPTRAALLTGRYQQRSGLEGEILVSGPTRQHAGLAQKEITIADLLKKSGYKTGIMGKWNLGFKKRFNPIYNGFDQFYGYLSGNIDYYSHYDNSGRYDWWHNLDSLYEKGYTTDLITKHSVDFIRRNKETPFFLYVAYEAVHVPLQDRSDSGYRFPGEDFSYYGPAKHRIMTYHNMVKIMDEDIGKILNVLKEEELEYNTMIIFCSDNGAVPSFGNNGILRGGKSTLFEGGIRVPAIVYWPGRIEPRVSDQPAMSFDFFPTILNIVGIDVPKDLKLDGIDLSPLLFEKKKLPIRNLFWQFQHQKAVRRGQWKLLIDSRGKGATDTLLFNLKYDLREYKNVKGEHPVMVKKLLSYLYQWEKNVGSLPQQTK